MTKIKRRESISPDLTPLIDIVFILLIFFLTTSVFKKDQFVLNLELPQAHGNITKVKPKQITIELNNNKIAYLGKKINLSKLDLNLQNITDKQRQIILRIDKKVPYQKVVKLLDILQKNNLNNLSLITQ